MPALAESLERPWEEQFPSLQRLGGIMDRRRVLGLLGWGLIAPYTLGFHRVLQAATAPAVPARETPNRQVFSLSVASGDPSPTGVILWTRIDPAFHQPAETLRFQVAEDRHFRRMLMEGAVDGGLIGPADDYTVKVDLDGKLGSDQRYYYRFLYGNAVSPTGRCRTAPAAGMTPKRLKLALLTCQDYTNGYYTALGKLAARDDVDFVVHVGDFIYETAGDPRFQSLPFADRTIILPSNGIVALDLADYRHLYRTYRSDPDLQRCMENHTFIIIWDDHETANDCYWDAARDTLGAPDHPYTLDPAYGNAPALLRALAMDARKAWLEFIPARVHVNPAATHPHDFYRIYRRFELGMLVDLFMLDGRSYRSPHACGEGDIGERYVPLHCQNYTASDRTMLGADQRDWLLSGTLASRARWRVWGNQTLMAALNVDRIGRRIPINLDAWDGYQAERRLLAEAMRDAGRPNLVVLSGDFHSHIVAHLKVDYRQANNEDPRNVIGAEFMTTSVTSADVVDSINAALKRKPHNPKLDIPIGNELVGAINPHIRFADLGSHGYSIMTFTDAYAEWTAYVVDKNKPEGFVRERVFRRLRTFADSTELREMPALDGWDRLQRLG